MSRLPVLFVILSGAKDLGLMTMGFFAALRMTAIGILKSVQTNY